MTLTYREAHAVMHAVRDWTAQEIAEKSGITAQTVNNWRTGRTICPRFSTLIAVAKAAGLRFALVPQDAFVRQEIEAPTKARKSARHEARAH